MCSFIFLYVMCYVCAVAHGVEKSFVYELYSENEINGNVISSFDTSSVQACVVHCDDTYGCLSVNFHKENEKCVLRDYYPTDETKSGVPESGWKIFFRRHFVWVNTKFTVTVSNSRDDVINDGGMLCGKYFGPGIDKAPFRLTITCANTIYGKFLKIKHDVDVAIALCEVFVYTPH